MNKKSGALDALNKFSQRQLDELERERVGRNVKRNDKPEKVVERACLLLMRAWGFKVEIYESKSTWDKERQIWRSQAMKAGTCDCMGTTEEGIAVAVEFKAPGRLSTFNSEARFAQRKFIVDRINSNAFACVVDSPSRLKMIYVRWKELRSLGVSAAREYLISMLPVQKARLEDERLFDDE